jgi:hypothetical protein
MIFGNRRGDVVKRASNAHALIRRLGIAALLLGAVAAPIPVSLGSGSVAAQACQTPFLVFTDQDNPGAVTETGPFRMVSGSGFLGEYRGDGRFAGYAIDGSQDAVVNTATGMANVRGWFTATSPDGGSSIEVFYTGQVDFDAGMAKGFFTASGGSGDDAGYTARGTIEGTVVGPATLDGADIGLC